MTTAKEWAQDKNCYLEIDENNNSWLWLSNGHIDRKVPEYMTPDDVLDRHDDIIINLLNIMYNDLQDNWLPVELEDENILRINGAEYNIISF